MDKELLKGFLEFIEGRFRNEGMDYWIDCESDKLEHYTNDQLIDLFLESDVIEEDEEDIWPNDDPDNFSTI